MFHIKIYLVTFIVVNVSEIFLNKGFRGEATRKHWDLQEGEFFKIKSDIFLHETVFYFCVSLFLENYRTTIARD